MIGVFAGVLALGRWVAGASLASTVVLVVLGVLAGVAVRPGSWWTTGWATALALVVAARHVASIRAWLRARGNRRSGGAGS